MTDVTVKVLKASQDQPLVYGWGSICKQRNADGEMADYWDTDNELYPEDVTEGAWRDFMLNSRHMDVQHDEKPMGRVVYAFPMLSDIAKSFGVFDALDRTGVLVGVQVDDPEILAKFRSGEYAGFSIGGSAAYQDVTE
ncbi:XkdF-like putative serine protease domain-containing protein [Klebsiella pneumoniae]